MNKLVLRTLGRSLLAKKSLNSFKQVNLYNKQLFNFQSSTPLFCSKKVSGLEQKQAMELVDELLDKAQMAYKDQNYEKCLAHYDEVIKIIPDFHGTYANKAMVYEQLEDYEEALIQFDKAIGIDSSYPGSYYNKGNVLSKMNRIDEAMECYELSIERDSTFFASYINLGACYEHLKQFEKSIECYDKVIELKPENINAYYNKGVALQKLHKPEEAVAAYDQALQIDPNFVNIWFNKGILLKELEGKQKESIQCFNKVLELEPSLISAKYYRGQMYIFIEDFENAKKDLDACLAEKCQESHCYYYKAMISFREGEIEDSLVFVDKAIELDPENEGLRETRMALEMEQMEKKRQEQKQ